MSEHATPLDFQPDAAPRASWVRRIVASAPRARPIILAALGVSLTGVLVGGLWAWIAAPIHAVVAKTHAGDRVHDYLGTESELFFIAPCLMLGLLTALAVIAPALAWQWRERRGPAMVVGLTIGMVIAAAAASGAGVLLVRLRYGAVDFDGVPLSSGSPAVAYVTQAPPVFFATAPAQVAVTLLWPAAIAALVYALMAAADSRDDLGGPPMAVRSPAQPIKPEAPEAAVS